MAAGPPPRPPPRPRPGGPGGGGPPPPRPRRGGGPPRPPPAVRARGAAGVPARGAPADVPAATQTPPPSSVPGVAGQETVAAVGSVAPDAEAAERSRPPRKRWVTVVIALAVALLLVAAALLLPRLFTVYVAPVEGVLPSVSDLLGGVT